MPKCNVREGSDSDGNPSRNSTRCWALPGANSKKLNPRVSVLYSATSVARNRSTMPFNSALEHLTAIWALFSCSSSNGVAFGWRRIRPMIAPPSARRGVRPSGWCTVRPGAGAQRKTLETRLRQLTKQHEWAAISDDEFLAARGQMLRALEGLPAAPAPRAPTSEALALADQIGEVWDASTPDQQAAFMREWFEEMRTSGDGGIEMHAREAYFPIVAAAVGGSYAAPWALLGSNQ